LHNSLFLSGSNAGLVSAGISLDYLLYLLTDAGGANNIQIEWGKRNDE